LLNQLSKKYQENIRYYSTLKVAEQNDLYVDIITDIERYRSLLQVMKDSKDDGFYHTNRDTFNSYNKLFAHFGRDNE
jgi:hypothetical protein